MQGYADVHCHLCAGLDDGPRTPDDALEMCHLAWGEGTRMVAATAHQNESWPEVTPAFTQRARRVPRPGAGGSPPPAFSVGRIVSRPMSLGIVFVAAYVLAELEVPLEIFPTAEVMVWAGLEEAWDRGELLSVADGGKYLLIELPGGLFLDLSSLIVALRERGLTPILVHPERHPELLHSPGVMQRWIELGCLAQVSSGSLTGEIAPRDVKVLRQWAERGHIHLIGSDGHSVRRRPARLDGGPHQGGGRRLGGSGGPRGRGFWGGSRSSRSAQRVPLPAAAGSAASSNSHSARSG